MSSTATPKLIEVPGIPGKLQEMTLDQYMSALQPTHLARVQLEDIRSLALEAMKTTALLLKSQEKVNELETEVASLRRGLELHTKLAPPPAEPKASDLYEQISKQVEPAPKRTGNWPRGTPYPKAPCPTCGLTVSCNPGSWHKHMKEKHGLEGVPNPIHQK
jgi:hypothetical protein